MRKPFQWDNYSDQPALLKDRVFKKKMRKKELSSLIKTFLISIFMLPIAMFFSPFARRKGVDSKEFFCVGIDYQKLPELSYELIEELDVASVLIRVKLWEMDKFDELKSFIVRFHSKKIILKIMQDRENIEDLELLKQNLTKIFNELQDYVDIFEIGTTINRSKWGFFSVREYNRFFKVAYDLKKTNFKNIQLIGSGVIDFEYHYTTHTLFNLCNYFYDGISSLLYVDRRGAPENKQMGFSLSDKISLLSSLISLSPKTTHKLYITETNWPISNTAPYAPTSEYECVDENSYANFMLRYYFLALASQKVDVVSWHQLIASGYGLVDARVGARKRVAFECYKFMVKTLKNAQFLRLDIKRDYHILQFLVDDKLLQIHWSLKEQKLKNEPYFHIFGKDGLEMGDESIKIDENPIYIFIDEKTEKQ